MVLLRAVTRYCISLRNATSPGTINGRLAAARRLAYEVADAGLLSPEFAAGIRLTPPLRPSCRCPAPNVLDAQALDNSIFAHDHVTSMPPRLSDKFCRQALQRPILLTVPDRAAWAPSPDLASRILVANLAQIPRPEQCLDAETCF